METVEKIQAKAQTRVPEPVVACGRLTPAIATRADRILMGTNLSRGARMRRASKQAGPTKRPGPMFKTNASFAALFVLTANKLYVFDSKVGGGGIKLLQQVAEWERSDLSVQAIPDGRQPRFIIDNHADGGHYDVEPYTGYRRGGRSWGLPVIVPAWNDRLLAELAAMAS